MKNHAVLFVCLGNICRSPMAEIVFRDLAERRGLGAHVVSTSSGTGDWHVGEQADRRTIEALARRGYDGERHRARQFSLDDFTRNDLIVALDRSHERILTSWARTPDDADRRKVNIALTDAGRGVVEETVRRRDSWLERALVDLTPAQRATLHDAAQIMREVAAK